MNRRWLPRVLAAVAAIGTYALVPTSAQETNEPQKLAQGDEFPVEHSDCSFFGPQRERFLPRASRGPGFEAGRLTQQFAIARAGISRAGRARPFEDSGAASANLIDRYIQADLKTNHITPADKTNDWEFARRSTLDLTGRIPTRENLWQFITSGDPDKRAAYIDQLLASPEWVDKWTMFYSDLYKNTIGNVQVNIRSEGRNAFYKWIHDSLAANKPYNQMATELIAAQGSNNFDQTNGQMNYLVLGVVQGGPAQDIFDQQTANIADVFLGLAHVNCVLCHNGRGHLDSLSLWASQTTRMQAWGLAAFMAHTRTLNIRTPIDPNNPNAVYNYWSLDRYTTDYALNTTTGNRPARQPVGSIKTVTPRYLFDGRSPSAGQDYRAALASYITSDFQFARAAVNYIWAQFFGVGIVDPPDQFDPARLDPNNPPPAPWTLQPTNPALLNALAQWFIDHNYDLRALMRLIVNSDTYQLASEYNGTWDPAWDKYFGRKFVRRLWAEEIHDSVAIASHNIPSYNVAGFSTDSTVYGVTSTGFGKVSYAMQLAEVLNTPDSGSLVSQFLDTFLRGNRDDQPRKSEGSIPQALSLMNDNFIQSRIHATGSGATASWPATLLQYSDDDIVYTLYLTILSRFPASDELIISKVELQTGGAAQRKQNLEDLMWTLFNKVDFVFNY